MRKPLIHDPELHARLYAPSGLTEAERKAAGDPGKGAEPMTRLVSPDVSPTGAPVVSPNTWGFRIMGVLMAVAGAVALKQPDLFPGTELDQQVATVLMAIIGFISPGLRRK